MTSDMPLQTPLAERRWSSLHCRPRCWLWACVAWLALAGARAGEKAEDGFRFVHLSDLHCARAKANPPPRFALDLHRLDLVHSFALLEAAVREINRAVKPDFVVITGDLVDRGRDVKSLARVKTILDKLACPYYPVIGDHDSRDAWRRVFGAGRLNYTFTHGGWRFIALDSSTGRLDEATMAWLRRTLASHAGAPAGLLLHRPIVVPEVYRAAVRRLYGVPLLLGNAGAVRELVRGKGSVRAVFAGHCHTAIQCQGGGVAHYVAPSLVELGTGYAVVEVRGATITADLRSLGH